VKNQFGGKFVEKSFHGITLNDNHSSTVIDLPRPAFRKAKSEDNREMPKLLEEINRTGKIILYLTSSTKMF